MATIAGNVVDLTQSARPPRKINVQWLDADTYIDLDTGEVKEAAHAETRGDKMAIPEVRRTLRRMRGLINSNFFGDANELFLTLTYRDNMTDPRQLYEDMRRFCQKARRQLGEIKYLAAVEPQERGAWHAHVLLKQMTAHNTYWPLEDIDRTWSHGWAYITKLHHADNVGAYLSAYLSNVPEDAEEQLNHQGRVAELGERVPKRVKKGARLQLYPRGMHIYRASQNLERPIVKKIRPGSAEHKALLERGEIRYQSQIILRGTDQDDPQKNYLINRISQMQINLNPQKNGMAD